MSRGPTRARNSLLSFHVFYIMIDHVGGWTAQLHTPHLLGKIHWKFSCVCNRLKSAHGGVFSLFSHPKEYPRKRCPPRLWVYESALRRLNLDCLRLHAQRLWNHPKQHETKYWPIRVPREGCAPRFGPSRAREKVCGQARATTEHGVEGMHQLTQDGYGGTEYG